MNIINRLPAAFIFAISAFFFFACSTGSDEDDSQNPNTGGTTIDADKQVYDGLHFYECDSPESCDLNKLYTGNGVLKEIIRTNYDNNGDDEIIDVVEMGTINNGKINLVLNTPKQEYLNENGNHTLFELMLYSNANEPIGRLILVDDLFNRDNSTIVYYVYSLNGHKEEYEWDLLPSQNVIFVINVDFKKDWNLAYENDKYYYIDGAKWQTLTYTTDEKILNGAELRWYLLPPDMH
jgi:hypothetical protein